MRVRWLGWAGVEIEADGVAVVIDPLADPGATFAALGEGARRGQAADGGGAARPRAAVAGLVSHLHRDHTDAGALAAALAAGRRRPRAGLAGRGGRREPRTGAGERGARAGGPDAPSGRGMGASRRPARSRSRRCRRSTASATPRSRGWWRRTGGASSTSATRSSTATGGGWRGATGPSTSSSRRSTAPVVDFPHLQPPSPLAAAMEPEQAALAGELLGARTVVPMHYDGFAIEPWYRPIDDAGERFEAAAAGRSYEARMLSPARASSPAAHRSTPEAPLHG